MIIDTDNYMESGKYYRDNYFTLCPSNEIIKQPVYCIRPATLEEYHEYANECGAPIEHKIKKYIYLVHTD